MAVAVIVAFGLNWLWEMAQMRAYVEMAGRPWQETVWPCAVASLGDVALTLVVYGIVALATGRMRWPVDGKWNTYAAASVLGAVCGLAMEWRALAQGRWSYTDQMPTIPVLGVGLWPLLQLALLVPVTLGIAGWRGRWR